MSMLKKIKSSQNIQQFKIKGLKQSQKLIFKLDF